MPTILITGASGGLAQEIVKLLPDDQVILLARNKKKLAQFYGNHPHADLIEIDIRDDQALEALVANLYQISAKTDGLMVVFQNLFSRPPAKQSVEHLSTLVCMLYSSICKALYLFL